jgi:small-conductance mechanosensitive channel
MRQIYRDTLLVVQSNLGYFLGFTGLSVMLDWLDAHEVVGVIIGIVMIYQLYRYFLFGQEMSLAMPLRGATFSSLGRFVIVLFFMILVPIVLIVAVAFGVMSPELRTTDFENSANLFLAFFLLFYGGILIAFGTALPATVAGEGVFASLSLARSRKTATDIAVGLLVGPAIIGAAYFAGLYYMTGSLAYEIDLSRLRRLVPAELAAAIALDIASTLQTVLMVVILCQAYQKVKPRPKAERLVQIFS